MTIYISHPLIIFPGSETDLKNFVCMLSHVLLLLIDNCFHFCCGRRQEKDSSKSGRYRNKGSKNGSDSDSNRKKSSSYGPTLGNPTQPYYVQPSDDRKLAPSAEMFHYQYQKDQNNTNLP